MKPPKGTPQVTMIVQIPMYFARSFLKNVSVTTADPIAPAGEMKKATSALQAAVLPYVGATAHPMLQTPDKRREMRKIGRRPNLFDSGFQNKGAPPRMAIWRDVK